MTLLRHKTWQFQRKKLCDADAESPKLQGYVVTRRLNYDITFYTWHFQQNFQLFIYNFIGISTSEILWRVSAFNLRKSLSQDRQTLVWLWNNQKFKQVRTLYSAGAESHISITVFFAFYYLNSFIWYPYVERKLIALYTIFLLKLTLF